jgi:RND superfamily putative drug exporter
LKPIAKFVVRHSKLALFGVVAIIGLSSILGFQSFANLKAGGYEDNGSESARVSRILESRFSEKPVDAVIIADFKQVVDDPSSVALADKLTKDLKAVDGVSTVKSYYSLGQPASLKSVDSHAAYFFVNFDEGAKSPEVATSLQDEFTGWYHGAKLNVAGWWPISASINHHITEDLTLAESIAIPLTVLLLIFVFGSLVAAGLPLLVAGISILGTFATLWVASQFTDTSIFGVNLATGMGLGLGIDYALLMVNRFREERALGHTVAAATENTVLTAGRTVFFSGLTVAVVLVSLSFFPQYFLKTFAVAGFSTVILAVVGAIIALPALLNLLGDKVNALPIFKHAKTKDHGAWSNLSRFVMRRPLQVLTVVLIGLAGVMSLSNGVAFGLVDDRVLPATDRAVVANDVIRDRFDGREGSPMQILVKNATNDQVIDYAIKLSKTDHVVRVESTAGIAQDGNLDEGYAPYFTGLKQGGWQEIKAIIDVEPRSSDGMKVTEELRAQSSNFEERIIGGSAAIYTDSMNGIKNQLGNVALWIIISTLILLFLFTGSVLLPIKAVILNILSLGATMGFITWVFISGNLKWLIGDFVVTGTVDASSMVLVAVIAFGLSMDYELFLLSRIKEQHDAGLSTTDSVSIGLQRSGRIITTAALVLAVSFLAFVISGVSIMKMMGLGIAFAILLDATVVRALLVPALMKLLAEANWWAPKWLKAVHHKLGLDH